MSNSLPTPCTAILATKVAGNRRASILPRYFPNAFLIVENSVYGFADKLCKQYTGAFWEFYELSNGGFYMSPSLQGLLDVAVPYGNGYEGCMSADALGIVVCLFAYCRLAEQHPNYDFGDFYWNLRGFAGEHEEASAIFAAID